MTELTVYETAQDYRDGKPYDKVMVGSNTTALLMGALIIEAGEMEVFVIKRDGHVVVALSNALTTLK